MESQRLCQLDQGSGGLRIPAGLTQFRALFSNADYRWYASGNFFSITGLWVQRVAIAWLVWELSHSAVWLGVIALAETGPTVVLGFPAGALLDRLNPLKVLRITQALTVAYSSLLALVTLAGWESVGLVAGLVLIRGVIFTLNRPARMTIVYALVGRDLLPNALAFNATVFNTAKFIGPALAGVTLVTAGAGATFAMVVGMQLVFTFCLARLQVDTARSPRSKPPAGIGEEIAEGLSYVMRHPGVRLQFLLIFVISLFAKPVTDLLPGFANGEFGRDAGGLAWMLLMHGLGATAGGIWLSLHNTLVGLVMAGAIGTIAMSIALVFFATTQYFWFACALLLVVGFSTVVVGISSQTLIQASIRTRYRGRVMSTYGMIAQGVPSIGAFLMGLASTAFGLGIPVLFGALVCLACGLLAWIGRKHLAARLVQRHDEQDHSAGSR
jgi:predicted MFS family arabinose efflux permease